MKHCWLIAAAVVMASFATGALAAGALDFQAGWERKPTGDEIARHFPTLAATASVAGRAVLGCTVTAQGVLKDCRVIGEGPKGFGFGQAALAMASSFRMGPAMRNGVGAEDTVRIPIDFRQPEMTVEASPAVSTEAMAEARAYIRDVGHAAAFKGQFMTKSHELEFGEAGGASEEVQAAVVAAVREMATSGGGLLEEQQAAALASVLTRDELVSLREGLKTPAGQLLWGQDPIASALALEMQRRLDPMFRSFARQVYCADHPCGAGGDLGLAADVQRSPPGVEIPFMIWSQSPPEEALYAAAPRLAFALGVAVRVRLTCRLALFGRVEGCRVAGEAPHGFSGGKAALSLVGYYRVELPPKSEALLGKTVPILVQFPASEDEGSLSSVNVDLATPTSVEARRVAEALASIPRNPDATLVEAFNSGPFDPEADVLAAGVAAFQVAHDQAVEEAIRYLAVRFDATLPSETLKAAAVLIETPTWRLLRLKRGAVIAAQTPAAERAANQVVLAIRASVCKAVSCELGSYDALIAEGEKAKAKADQTPATADPSTDRR